jgi:hypothetical protein
MFRFRKCSFSTSMVSSSTENSHIFSAGVNTTNVLPAVTILAGRGKNQ